MRSGRLSSAGSRTALLVCDLEGVVGADTVGHLVASEPGWAAARARLTEEVNAAVRGLCAQGIARVRVSDSHRPGGVTPNVLADALDPRASLHLLDDAFSPELFEGVDLVCALGMHVGGGVPGFVAHTVELPAAWVAGRRRLSETDLLFALAAEVGAVAGFVSGDDRLVDSLRGARVTTVQTKTAVSATRARSRGGRVVLRELERAAALPGVPLRVPPLREVVLHLKSSLPEGFGVSAVVETSRVSKARRAKAQGDGGRRDRSDASAEAVRLLREAGRGGALGDGVVRLDAHRLRVEGATTRETYDRALRALVLLSEVGSPLGPWVTGQGGLVDEVEAALRAGWPSLRSRAARSGVLWKSVTDSQ